MDQTQTALVAVLQAPQVEQFLAASQEQQLFLSAGAVPMDAFSPQNPNPSLPRASDRIGTKAPKELLRDEAKVCFLKGEAHLRFVDQ